MHAFALKMFTLKVGIHWKLSSYHSNLLTNIGIVCCNSIQFFINHKMSCPKLIMKIFISSFQFSNPYFITNFTVLYGADGIFKIFIFYMEKLLLI